MKKYLGVKLIEAELQVKGIRDGYKVVYPDGYVSWSPKDVFEEAYRETDGLTFGLAVEALKKGYRVARIGWNGKGMFLEYVIPYHPENKDFCCDRPQCQVHDINHELLSWLGMKTADNKFVPWLASQTDILADDWQIVE